MIARLAHIQDSLAAARCLAFIALGLAFVAVLMALNPADASGKVTDPGCYEDEAAVVAPWRPGTPKKGLTWACVTVDDFADPASIARLDNILNGRNP